jgi:uncharacterized cupredoxin-like copper-binding protein
MRFLRRSSLPLVSVSFPSVPDVTRWSGVRWSGVRWSGVGLIGAATLLLVPNAVLAASPTTKKPPVKTAPAMSKPAAKTAAKPAKKDAITVIDIEMGTSKYSEATIVVKAGKPIRFRFKNVSTITHEALIGDAAAQAAHEKMMKEMGGMHMGDDADSISVESGKTKTLDFTFAKPGRTMIGCHQPGHYKGGMKLNIVIQSGSGIA